MCRNGYHLLAIHKPPAGESGQGWIVARLADARAELLYRLGLGSAGLWPRGLRLLLESPQPWTMTPPSPPASLGITLRVVAVGHQITIAEALHTVTDIWRHRWRGTSVVRVADGGSTVPLPMDLHRRAAAWLGLERGAIGPTTHLPMGPVPGTTAHPPHTGGRKAD